MLRAYEGQKQGTQGTHNTHTHPLHVPRRNSLRTSGLGILRKIRSRAKQPPPKLKGEETRTKKVGGVGIF